MDRQTYVDWIRKVRGRMSQEEFGKRICHFKNERGIKVCKKYHRNEVSNWEKGKNLPLNLESFISIALLDYDMNYHDQTNDGYRNQRFQFVQSKMRTILGQELYCRRVHDALLIQVCRDIITFEEMPELEIELDQIVRGIEMDIMQKKDYALQRGTKNIAGNLSGVMEKGEIKRIIIESSAYFYTGVRTFGERMKRCYESRQRYAALLSFTEAVRIYAPNYRDSFGRIFISSGITRRWIIDLCVHLRFNREEIQDMLQNARMIPLSKEPCDREYYFAGRDGMPIGSAAWYQYMEKRHPEEFKGHFSDFQSFKLTDKMMAACLMGIFAADIGDIEELVPVDYLLESFMWYDCGKDALKVIRQIYNLEHSAEEAETEIKNGAAPWFDYLESGLYASENENMKKVYCDYCHEFKEYYILPEIAEGQGKYHIEAVKLHYFASLLYSIFTGRYYTGRVSEDDLKEIKEQFRDQTEGWEVIYRVINQFLVTFLSGRKLYEDKNGQYCCMINNKKKTAFDMEGMKENIWESLKMLINCTK